MLTNPFMIDVSKYQGTIDWDVVASHTPKVVVVGIRGGISWGFVDPQFQRNWSNAKRVGLYRTVYHVLYPGQGAQRQMDNLFSYLPPDDLGELPISLDLERDFGQTKKVITDEILSCAEIIKSRTGRKPILYSRAQWIDTYTNTGAWRGLFDEWLAQYLPSPYHTQEHPGPVTLPVGSTRDQVIIHQTCAFGEPFGVQSKALDYNRWQFDLNHLMAYVGIEKSEEEVEEVLPIDISEEVKLLREDLVEVRDEAQVILEASNSALDRLDLILEA